MDCPESYDCVHEEGKKKAKTQKTLMSSKQTMSGKSAMGTENESSWENVRVEPKAIRSLTNI